MKRLHKLLQKQMFGPVVVFNPSIRHQVGVNSRRAKKGFFHLIAKNSQKALIGQ